MKNPFEYGGVVSARSFCNRETELRDLRRTIENAGRLFLYAERRMGKTSLLKRAAEGLPSEHLVVYVDLWPTDSTSGFTKAFAQAVTEATGAGSADRLLEVARELFSSLRPGVTIDERGAPVLTFGLGRAPAGSEPELDEVIRAPARLAEERETPVAVVFDEFQQITTYDAGSRLERKLRSAVQHHEDVAYLFLGSRKHMIQEMFLSSERPLYRSAEHYPLRPISEESWRPFIQERFQGAGKAIPDDRVTQVYKLTGGHPFYVQHLCHVLWERCEEGEEVGEESIREAVDLLLERESYAYGALWESLTKNQGRFLRGLAGEKPPGEAQPFSSRFVQQHGLGSPSSAQRAAEALLERDLIDRENGSFIIIDRFFRLWIRRRQSGEGVP